MLRMVRVGEVDQFMMARSFLGRPGGGKKPRTLKALRQKEKRSRFR